MVGRADKGVLITTGGFTLEARREATRDGAPPVVLIDGQLLAEKLKELKLGVKTNPRGTHRGGRGMVSLHLARGGEQPSRPYMDFSVKRETLVR